MTDPMRCKSARCRSIRLGSTSAGLNLWTLSPHRRRRNFREGDVPKRHLPGELAAERLLARQPGRRQRRGAGAPSSPSHATEPVASVLDADRGAAARRQAGWKGLRLRADVVGTDGRPGQASLRPRVAPDQGRIHRARTARRHRSASEEDGTNSRCEVMAESLPDSVGDRQLPDRLAPEHRRRQLHRRQLLAVPDPARGAPAAPRGESVAGLQEPRRHAHHQRLLSPAPCRVEHRRSCRRPGRVRRKTRRSRRARCAPSRRCCAISSASCKTTAWSCPGPICPPDSTLPEIGAGTNHESGFDFLAPCRKSFGQFGSAGEAGPTSSTGWVNR